MKNYKPRVSHFGYEQSQNTAKSEIIKLGRNLEQRVSVSKYKKKNREALDKMDEEEEFNQLVTNQDEVDEVQIEEDQ